MSNLSDIGFPARSNEDINDLIETWVKNVVEIPCSKGVYLKFSDPSGAQVYLQMEFAGELLGFNPFFDGKSRRQVFITERISRDTSELDGGYHAWANAEKEGEGDYPFIFDLPDIFVNDFELPKIAQIQLNAFATNDLKIFEDEAAYYDSQKEEPKLASQSFIPSGLFRENMDIPPQAHAILAGEIKDSALKINQTTNEKFYWIFAETLGGDIDILADANLIKDMPKNGGIISGSFWLTGRIAS